MVKNGFMFKDANQIQEEIWACMDNLDLIIQEWSKARADYEYASEFKKVALALEKEKHEGSDAERTRKALASDGYKKYLWRAFEIDCLYFQLDGRKNALERRLDGLRSLLSFENRQINRAI